MTDAHMAGSTRLLIVGYGAAGQAYAGGLAKAGADVTAIDPFADGNARSTALAHGVALTKNLPENLHGFDLVIILTPATASLEIVRQLADRLGDCPVLDLTSSVPGAMHQAESILDDRLIDGTVLGAVGIGGIKTPMVFAGKHSPMVADMLRVFGCHIDCIAGGPGSASALKLLRSLFMKGLEALVVETQLAARALGQSDGLRIALADLAHVDMPAFLDEMLRTHPKHAGRRTVEIEAALSLMKDANLTPVMLPAAHQFFARTAACGIGPDETPDVALKWLDHHFNPKTEPANATI